MNNDNYELSITKLSVASILYYFKVPTGFLRMISIMLWLFEPLISSQCYFLDYLFVLTWIYLVDIDNVKLRSPKLLLVQLSSGIEKEAKYQQTTYVKQDTSAFRPVGARTLYYNSIRSLFSEKSFPWVPLITTLPGTGLKTAHLPWRRALGYTLHWTNNDLSCCSGHQLTTWDPTLAWTKRH